MSISQIALHVIKTTEGLRYKKTSVSMEIFSVRIFLSTTSGKTKQKMSRAIVLLCFGLAFVAVAIRGAEIPDEFKDKAKPIREACIAETGATVDMIEKSANGDFTDDQRIKCYFKCILEAFKLIDGDNINFDMMMQLLPESMKKQGTETIKTCRGTAGSDICDKAFNFMKCYQKTTPEIFFVI